jgi:predicted transcriptional regulator
VPKRDDEPVPGGELEMALLSELWRRRRATGRELYEEVGRPRGIVYTTVAKVLDRMVEKGIAERRSVGRSYEYAPVATRTETLSAMAREFFARISGSGARPAVAALIGALEDTDPQLLDDLEAELRARRGREE